MTIDSNFPTSLDVIGTIPDAPFFQSQTITVNGTPMTHRELLNFLFRATEAEQTKLGAGDSAPTDVGEVLQVSGSGETEYGPITPANIGTIPSARVRYAGNQNLSDNAETFIDFFNTVRDTDAMFSVSHTSRLTCNTAGLYHITANVFLNGPTAGRFALSITLNSGRTKIAQETKAASANSLTAIHVCTDYQLAVNDYIEVGVTCGGIGTTTTLDGTTFPSMAPVFSASWLMP